MTAFLIVAAMLVAVVVLVLLRPLLRRPRGTDAGSVQASNARVYSEQLADIDADFAGGTLSRERWSAARVELERRALEEESAAPPKAPPSRAPGAAIAIAVALPVAAFALYAALGTPAALLPAPPREAAAGPQVTPEQINAMVAQLAAKMQANPQDTAGWIMLGRSYAVLGRYPEAARAYGKAADQRPNDAALLADYADALAMANNRTLAGQPEQILRRALKADPDNLKVLVLIGTAAFERKDYREAVKHWEKAVSKMPEDSDVRQSLQRGIDEAKKRQK
jgi:cytochrome c-type biogenesis protein CcmH